MCKCILYDTILCDIKIIKYLFYSVDIYIYIYKVLLEYLTFRCIFFFFFFFFLIVRRGVFTLHKNLPRCREQEGSATFSNSYNTLHFLSTLPIQIEQSPSSMSCLLPLNMM